MNPLPPRPIAKSGSALLFSQFGLNLINIGFTVYVLRVLSKPEIAVLAVLEVLVSVLTFSELGFGAVATQRAPAELQSEAGRPRALGLIKASFIYRSLVMLALGAIGIYYAAEISQLLLKTGDYAWAIIWLIPGAAGVVLFNSLQLVAQISDDFYLLARWNFIAGVLRQALPLAVFFPFGFYGYMVGMFASIVIPVIGLGWPLRRFIFNRAPLPPFWFTFRYGLPFYLRNFLRFGYLQYDQILVAILLSPTALAGYSVARRFTKLIIIITEAIQIPMSMRMAAIRNDPDAVQAAFFRKATRYTTLIIIPLSLMVAAASPWIMHIYGGEQYIQNWPALAILALAQAGYGIYTIYGSLIFARLEPLASLRLDGVAGGINFFLAPVLIFVLGQYGVAWGQLLGFTVGMLVAVLLLRAAPAFRYDWNGLQIIAAPLLAAGALVIAGQILYYNLWVIPLYLAAAGAFFAWTVGQRLYLEDWEQIRAFLPGVLLPWMDRVQGIFQITPRSL